MAFRELSRWTKALDDRLTAMWLAGSTSSEIAPALGPDFTKNMVIGRAHRLKLPARRSPIGARAGNGRKAGGGASRSHRPATYPDGLPAPEGMVRAPGGALVGDTLAALGVVAAGPAVPVPAPAAVVVALPGVSRPCCWPLWGDRERATHRYCEVLSVPGRSYCAEHCGLAYSTMPVRSAAQLDADEARRIKGIRRALEAAAVRAARL